MQYPNQIKKNNQQIKNKNYANRGMTLENDLNITNDYYLINNIAIINKKPTPIKVVKIIFNKQKQAIIKEAYFKKPSTTDYNGIYKGKYIDFEAKETKNTKFFPINNINDHQIKHIKGIINHKGISFVIIRFSVLNKTFLLKGTDLIFFIDKNKRKTIPLTFFLEKAFLIKESFEPRLNYLKIIDKIYMKDEINEEIN
jgi:recombination protein U